MVHTYVVLPPPPPAVAVAASMSIMRTSPSDDRIAMRDGCCAEDDPMVVMATAQCICSD
jgi:hypothetical protein